MTSARTLEWEDIKTININQYVCIEKIQTMSEEDLEYLEETFVTFLCDGQECELEKGGRNKKLTALNRKEFIEKTKQIHLSHLRKPFEMIRRGFVESSFAYSYLYTVPSALEAEVCGMNYVTFI